MRLPIMVKANGGSSHFMLPCSLRRCWLTLCNVMVEEDGIGLCAEHLDELRTADAEAL